MSEFRSLYAALKGWYCKPLADYPTDLREWVGGKGKAPLAHRVKGATPAGNHNLNSSERNFWDGLTPARRIAYAKEWDHMHDPSTKARRDEINRFYDDYEKLKHEITRWENANAPTVMEMAKRDEILAPLKSQLEVMDLKRSQMLGDPDAEREAATDTQGDAKKAMQTPEEAESEDQDESNLPWQARARKIADELFDHDTKLKTRDCLLRKKNRGKYVGGYAYRVMEIMQEREIHGPRGRIDNAGYIAREALQGDKWWANKSK